MPTSVRLDTETEALLRRLARSSGRTKSEVIREALHRMAASGNAEAGEAQSLYQALGDLIGIADGPEDLAEHHKKRFREKLNRQR